MLALVSLVALGGLIGLLLWNPMKRPARTGDPREPLHVYVAAGVREPIEEAGRLFEDEVGIGLRIDAKSSGALLATIEQSLKGDLYIPADETFIADARRKNLIDEVIPIGSMRLVVAVARRNPKGVAGFADLFHENITVALPNDETASAKAAMKALGAEGWEKLKRAAKVEQPTVTEVALSVQTGAVTAGVIWDTTARQFGLDSVDIAEFAKSKAIISAAVLKSSKRPTDALRLARFLAAPDRGQKVMEKHFYAPAPGGAGDPWSLEPKITLFSGGLNGVGVRQTIDDFRRREGVHVVEEYQGCGVLIGMMKAGQHPDAYFACDVSFTPDVADLFVDFRNVSQTRMVILVPKANPKKIATLEDLAKPGVSVGVADEEKSALGALTKNLLIAVGAYEGVKANTKATAPTADFLVAQLVESGKLDAVVVYEANCNHVKNRATVIPIPHTAALAIQPIGVSKETKYPRLVARLRDAITAAQSRQRFEQAGFTWVWEGSEPPRPRAR